MSMGLSRTSFFRGLLIFASLCVLGYAAVTYRTVRTFRHPVAYTYAHQRLYVLEKERNTLLELDYPGNGSTLEASGAYEIERDDADRYYMVRKLYPGPEGLVVQSFIYALQTREFLGYRFSLYLSPRHPPKVLLTIIFKNPQEYPEVAYAFDAWGNHYLVNNVKYQFNIWKVPAAGGIQVDCGQIPEQVQTMGERNGPLDQWEAVTVGTDGRIYVSSGASGQIMVYSPQGEKVGQIGSVGFDKGSLLAPDEVFFAPTSEDETPLLTVASKGNRTWVQFDEKGAVRRVVDPLSMGYPFADALVGFFRFDPGVGGICSFDPVNKSYTWAEGGSFKAGNSYSVILPGRTAALLACSLGLFVLGACVSPLVRRFEGIRVPFFIKLLIPLVILLVCMAKFVGDEVQTIMGGEILAESTRRSHNLAKAVLNSLSLADLRAIQEPEDREGSIYEKIYQAVTRILNRQEVEQTPKWILHKIRDGRYYFGINIWRGAIYMPYVVPEDRRMFFRVLEERIPQYGKYVDEEGEWFSYLTPVLDEKGTVIYVLELYRPAEEMRRADQQVFRRVSQVVGMTVSAAALLVLVFSYVFTRPLRRLTRRTEIISKGDFEQSIDIQSRDELGDLARAFNKMVGDLKSYTRKLAQDAVEKEALAGELRLARQVQREMLPQSLDPIPGAPNVSLYAEMEPAREVGGDYYDFFLVDEDHLGVVVADVSGKGIPAGLFMMKIRAILRGSAYGNLSPADTFSRINQIIAEENSSAMFVTMFYFICDLHTGGITYCNAGHLPPLKVHDDGRVSPVGTETTAGKGFPIGIMDDALYSDGHFQLASDETLVLYTDGVTESCNNDAEMFTEERFARALENLPAYDPKDICLHVLNEVVAHQGTAQQADDITILAFRLHEIPRAAADSAGSAG
jgi:serine phosphatase RsbU (regulator of sigma subunit)